MRRYALWIGVASLLLAAEAPKNDVKKEIEKFQGTWKFESMEMEGMKVPPETFEKARLILKGEQFTSTTDKAAHRGTFKVDLSKKIKTIDVTFTEGPEKGTTMLGIYELEGDTYKACFALKGKERPTEFSGKAGSGHVLEVLKREKP